jgi:hypothetical protein
MRNLVVLVLLIVAGGVFAKDNLAILPFTGGAAEEGETIAELFSFEPALTSVFNPVPRTSINRAIRNEQRFQMTSGMTDPDTIAALGKQLGARYVVSGSITALGSRKLLIIAILKIDDMRQIAGDVQTYGNIEEIQDKLPAMARNIATAAGKAAPSLPRLALPPVELSGGAERRDADALAQILAVNIIRGGKYAVYPRTASLERLQDEYANQLSGDTAEEHLADMGRGTNPERVLSVTARKLGTRNMFNAAVINLVTGVQEAGQTVNYQGLDDGIRAMEDIALALGGSYWKVSDTAEFARALIAVNADTKGGNYTISLGGSFASGPVTFTGNVAKTVTLKGEASARTISRSGDGPLFTVPARITLVLDNNIVLDTNNREGRLVKVGGGTLVMKAGSALRGSTRGGGVEVSGGGFTMEDGTISGTLINNNDGGGVYVNTGGSFTMSGGTISGNTAASSAGGGVCVNTGGSFTMSGGTISGNTAASGNGGGVCVNIGGTFTMSGGTISGNQATSSNENHGAGGGVFVIGGFTMSGGTISGNRAENSGFGGGGVYVRADLGSFVKSGGTIDAANTAQVGKVVYVYYNGNSYRIRNSTAGPGVNLDTNISGRAGGWE